MDSGNFESFDPRGELIMKKMAWVLLFALSCAFAGPVSWYGALTVDGNRIKNSTKSMEVQLKGPSLFWADGTGLNFYNRTAMDWFVDTLDIAVIRYAMHVQYMESSGRAEDQGAGQGYLSNENNKSMHLGLIDDMVQLAIRNDIYIIIDWHSHRAQNEQAAAVDFFKNMATKYMGVPNVIFEIYNEPPGNVSWGSISGYMSAVVQAIRNTGNNNLILVGSPSWSSNPNEAANGGLHRNYANIAYAMHFYAGTHTMTNGTTCTATQCSNSMTALNSGAAVFVSEWGTTSANGGGNPNANSTTNWTNWMDANKISSCNWSASNVNETSSMFNANASVSAANLKESGRLFFKYMGGTISNNNAVTVLGRTNPPAGYPWGRSITVTMNEGYQITYSLANLSATNGATVDSVWASEGYVSGANNQVSFTVPPEAQGTDITVNYWLSQGSNKSKHRIAVKVNRGPRISVSELNVSKTSSTELSLTKLGISHPTGVSVLSFTAQTVSAGTISRSSDNKTLTFTPPSGASENQKVTLTYTVVANGISRNQTVTLTLQNVAPVAGNQTASTANTTPYTFSLDFAQGVGDKLLPGRDDDGDRITIFSARVDEGFPGSVSISSDKRSLTYTPQPGMKSGAKPIVIYKLTDDGRKESNEGRLTFTITGEGTDIPASILQFAGSYGPGLQHLGAGRIRFELAKSGFATLDVYSLSGKKLKSLLNGYQNAGSSEISLADLQKGVYILRLKADSQVKIMRIVK
jgi:endoglucanase